MQFFPTHFLPFLIFFITSSHTTECFQTITNFGANQLSQRHSRQAPQPQHLLHATKKRKKSSSRTSPASGFGGAAVEPCPCGSGLGYMKCCGKMHKSEDAYAQATAEQVVRARYSAYAKREVDFIIGSTHPLNEHNFMADIDHWKKTIRENCYDNFELTECKILSETYEGEGEKQVATVKFIATMIQRDSREKTAFMETSTFERAGKHIRGGAWLYKDGVIETPEGGDVEQSQ